MKIFYFLILLFIPFVLSCENNLAKPPRNGYYNFWIRQENNYSFWTCYLVSSEEGLASVYSWIARNKKLLDYPAYNLSIIPGMILYYEDKEGNTVEDYTLLTSVPKDFSVPKDKQEHIEHIPKSEIERLINLFKEHSTSYETDKGPYR